MPINKSWKECPSYDLSGTLGKIEGVFYEAKERREML